MFVVESLEDIAKAAEKKKEPLLPVISFKEIIEITVDILVDILRLCFYLITPSHFYVSLFPFLPWNFID